MKLASGAVENPRPRSFKIGILLVHGIGTEHAEWAEEIIPRIQEAILSEARKLLPENPPRNADEIAVMESVYWADTLNEKQRVLEERLNQAQEPLRLTLRLWLSFRWLWRLLAWWLRRKEYEFVSRSVADVIGYLQTDAEKLVHQRMEQALDRLVGDVGVVGRKAPLTIVSHSLGTVISSDFVYDQTKKRRAAGKAGFHEKAQLENFFTVGSPLALFSIKYGGPDAFKNPISVESSQGRWINIRDADDPIGMPLKVLNEAYDRVVQRDVRVNAGLYLISHMRYFRDRDTLKIIGGKVALDWIALNGRLPKERVSGLRARYDEDPR